jgi:hypothetical protein
MDEIQITKRVWTAETAFAKLDEIFKELQNNPVTHDTWDWMDAHFALEVIRVCYMNECESLKGEVRRWKDLTTAAEAQVERLTRPVSMDELGVGEKIGQVEVNALIAARAKE